MTSRTKISTCSYCEARVIMDITAGSRHELVCRACGAPLENTELLEPAPARPAPVNPAVQTTPSVSVPAPLPAFSSLKRSESEKSRGKSGSKYKSRDKSDKKRKKKKKKRGLVYWVKEAIDEIEDLFD